MPKRKRRSFTPEQKADAVRMVREVGSVPEVARRLDLTETALRHWVKQTEIDEGKGLEGALTTEERELRRLRRRVRTLEMERDFARKAAAYFAKARRIWISVRADLGGEGASDGGRCRSAPVRSAGGRVRGTRCPSGPGSPACRAGGRAAAWGHKPLVANRLRSWWRRRRRCVADRCPAPPS